MKYQTLLFACSLLSYSLSFGQSRLKTSFYFPLHFKDYSQVLLKNKFDGKEKTLIPQFVIAEPYSTTITNASLDLDYKTQVKPEPQSFGAFNYTLDIAQSSISIEKIMTDTVITQVVGGVTVNVHVKGQCQGVQLKSNSPMRLEGQFHVATTQGQLVTQMQDYSLSNVGEWSIQMESCVGPNGYEQVLKGEISKLLKDPTSLKRLLSPHLQNKFNSLTESLNQALFTPKSMKISDALRVQLNPEQLSFDPSNGKIILSGQLVTETGAADSVKNEMSEFADLNVEDIKSFNSSGLLVPHRYTEALNKILFQEKFMEKKISGQEISGFKKLLASRFFQFFIWPDLMNFSTSAPFQFQFSAKSQPQITHVGYSEGSLWFSVKAQILGKMWAPLQNKLYPYLDFHSPLNMYTWLGVSEGNLVIGSHQPQMQLVEKWNKNYLNAYNPSTYIGLSTIQSEIISAVSDAQLSYPLPTIEMDQKKLLVPKKFFSTKKWIQLIFEAP